MTEPFNLVSVADFERMSRAEKDKYIGALVAHLQAIKQVPLGEALSVAPTTRSPVAGESPSS